MTKEQRLSQAAIELREAGFIVTPKPSKEACAAGGRATARKLTPRRRQDSARKAAKARWAKVRKLRRVVAAALLEEERRAAQSKGRSTAA